MKKTKRPTKKAMMQRIVIVLVIIVFGGFGADLLSLIRIQLINNEQYQLEAEKQQLSVTKINAERGAIYDANEKLLAESASAWQIYIVPSKINDEKRDFIADGLAKLLDVDKEEILTKTQQTNSYTVVKGKVEDEDKDKVREFIKENELNEFIGITPDTKRYYPNNNLASTLLGYTGSDDQGLSGIEKYYDDDLSGTPGRIVSAKDARREQMPNQYESTIDPKKGNDLYLTIDEVIQYYLEKHLEQAYKDTQAKSVSGIVMDIKTGGILAMSSKLDYDPNDPFEIYDPEKAGYIDTLEGTLRKESVYEAQQAQWRNHIISDTYEPGSVFKIITAAAALEEGVISDADTFTCTGSMNVAGRTIHCHKRTGHGTQTFEEGMKNSCNPVFIQTAQKLGVDAFYKYLLAFGLNETTGIDLPGEVKGIIHNKDIMGISELSSCSFGQSLTVTPLQMINAMAAIANDGKMMEPYLVEKSVDENGNNAYTHNDTVKRQVISKQTAEKLCDMLGLVVSEGTGTNAYVPGYRVAGKTGTSEKIGDLNPDGSKKRIASFCGFAPADDPQIAILVIIDEPVGTYYGGAIAAPLGGALFEEIVKYLNVEPRYTDEELNELDSPVPTLTGMSLEEAKAVMDNTDLNLKIVGDGDKVISQCPAGGQSAPKEGVVVIYTDEDAERKTVKVPNLVGLTLSEVNSSAVSAGLNIKLSGKSLEKAGVVSYEQSIEEGKDVEIGTVITVSFKNTSSDEIGD